jgi:hypothetical protein
MAKPHGPGDGDGDGDGATSSGRNRPGSGGATSVAAAQDTAERAARAGRSSGNGGSPARVAGSGRDPITHPTGDPGGTPDGEPTRIRLDEDEDVRRSLERENSGAAILADKGHQIKQNPSPDEVAQARLATGDSGRPTSRPDYLLEGRVFDCYSPSRNKGVRGIWSEVEKKVNGEQTQRVVVNLEDWGGNLRELRRQFGDWPMERLKELKVITPDGDIVQITPAPQND